MLAFDFEQISPTQLGVAALLAAIGIVYVASRRQRRPYPTDRRSQREARKPAADIQVLQSDLGSLITELESLSARLSAEAESRESKLHGLIAQADERIAALQSQVSSPTASRPLGPNPVNTPTASMPTLRSLVAPASSVPATDDRHRAIYALADEGLTAVEIAQRTGQRAGEIELILNLRPKPPSIRRT